MKTFSVVFGLLLASGASWAQQYVISTIAGGAPPHTPAAALTALIGSPYSIATGAAGELYFTSLACVFKLDQAGILTRMAGNSRGGLSGDGGPATGAQLAEPSQLSGPSGVAVDGSGNLFIADTFNGRVRKVSTSGIITTVAGNGTSGFSGDGGPATNARLSPIGVAVDGAGNLFIAEGFAVRKVSSNGIITTVAGNGTAGSSGDGGPATSAQLNDLRAIAIDGAGNLFIAGAHRVRRVSTSGIITTVTGNGTSGFSGDGGPATNAQLNLNFPAGLSVDRVGNLFIADSGNHRVRKVSISGIITTVAGSGSLDFSGDGGPATNAQLNRPSGVAVDGSGNLFIADTGNYRVRKVSIIGTITTVAGNGTSGFSGDTGPATDAQLDRPYGLAVDGAGNLFIADTYRSRVRKVSASGIITTVAGGATNSQLYLPYSVAVDGAGNLFIADTFNNRVQKVSTSGIITTVAGNGTPGFSGDGGPATNAQLDLPIGVAVDGAGNFFIADYRNDRVRKVSASGTITTVAGDFTSGSFGPSGVAVDGAGNLFITTDNRVRKVSTSGIITTVAGNGTYGFSGDGGPAANAQLNDPSGVAVDGAGNIYVAENGNNAVRLLRPAVQSVLIGTVVDAASQASTPVSPGKIIVIYGAGLGPSQLEVASPSNDAFGTQLAGTKVSFSGIVAPIIYTSATQVAAIVPYAILGTTANVTVTYQGQASAPFSVPVAASAPSFFTSNQTGAGQAASINALDGTFNTAVSPVKIGDYISLYATGEGQTTPAGVDGKLAGLPLPQPNLPVTVTVGGIPATVQYSGAVFGTVGGLMQVNVQIPSGVQPGGYVPVVLKVGNASTVDGAVWIAVARN